jgi:hypothetical protein
MALNTNQHSPIYIDLKVEKNPNLTSYKHISASLLIIHLSTKPKETNQSIIYLMANSYIYFLILATVAACKFLHHYDSS